MARCNILLVSLRCGGSQIMSISAGLGVTKRNVTALVDALEEEGLVRHKPHPTDRRAPVIEMSEEGSEAVGRMYEEHRATVAELFLTLPEENQKELSRLISTLQEAVQRGCTR